MRHTRQLRPVVLPALGPALGTAGLLLTVLLAGCGSGQPPAPVPAPSPAPPAAAGSAPAATPEPIAPADPVTLPWPAADPETTADLQRAVDNGTEPWLLDPAEVAVSYATAAHGWVDAQAQPAPDGRTVRVAEGDQRLTLSLTQPGRTGAGGIWVVTAERAGG